MKAESVMTATTEAFAQLIRIAGKTPAAQINILDEAPGMQTRFHAEAAAAAALAATGAMAADLWVQRGGRAQDVTVSTREAGAALVSFAFQKFADASRAPPARPASAEWCGPVPLQWRAGG